MAVKAQKEEPSTRRRYPRAGLSVKVRLSVGSGDKKLFAATLRSRDISVSGIFFESTFFLKIGQVLDVEFRLPPQQRLVRARGRVVRVETLEEGGRARGGFAIRFEEYYDSSDVALANYFLAPTLREFLTKYAQRTRLRLSSGYADQLVEILSAWELSKMSEGKDMPWHEEKQPALASGNTHSMRR